jgi:Spy/CpxP family protein refolding chaperone
MDSGGAPTKEKINALHQARSEAKKDLAKAQQELREVLTPRQKAIMFMIGWLD